MLRSYAILVTHLVEMYPVGVMYSLFVFFPPVIKVHVQMKVTSGVPIPDVLHSVGFAMEEMSAVITRMNSTVSTAEYLNFNNPGLSLFLISS